MRPSSRRVSFCHCSAVEQITLVSVELRLSFIEVVCISYFASNVQCILCFRKVFACYLKDTSMLFVVLRLYYHYWLFRKFLEPLPLKMDSAVRDCSVKGGRTSYDVMFAVAHRGGLGVQPPPPEIPKFWQSWTQFPVPWKIHLELFGVPIPLS
jgi:hypothetical protein